MTEVEHRLRDALARFDEVAEAPDLYERIEDAVEADERRRRALRRGIAAASTGVVVLIALATWMVQGGTDMDWWILELLTTALLFGLAFALGPFIRKYGKSFVADAFGSSPRTGKTYVVLTDVAYYLIFSGYIFLTASFKQRTAWGLFGEVTADQLQHEAARIGGILAIIGVLHAVNLILLPIVGRLMSADHRREQ